MFVLFFYRQMLFFCAEQVINCLSLKNANKNAKLCTFQTDSIIKVFAVHKLKNYNIAFYLFRFRLHIELKRQMGYYYQPVLSWKKLYCFTLVIFKTSKLFSLRALLKIFIVVKLHVIKHFKSKFSLLHICSFMLDQNVLLSWYP